MKLMQLAKILAVGTAFSASAHAETIAYTFSGQLVDPFGSYDVGTPFSGTFSYVRPQQNRAEPPPGMAGWGYYTYKNISFQIGSVTGGYSSISNSFGDIYVTDNTELDYFGLSPADRKNFGNVGGLALTFFQIALQDLTGNVFNNFSLPGQGMTGSDFTRGDHYSEASLIELQSDQATLTPGGPHDAPVFARGLLDYLGPVNMPFGTDTSIYRFNVENVGPNSLTFIDPLVAIGYDYAIGAGDPNFASLLLPNIGDGQFTIEYLNGDELVQLALAADTPFYFPTGGVSAFKVRGIETAAALDPNDTNAFITGLSFISAGNFTGTMTPVTVDTAPVPLPSGFMLFFSGIAGLIAANKRKRIR